MEKEGGTNGGATARVGAPPQLPAGAARMRPRSISVQAPHSTANPEDEGTGKPLHAKRAPSCSLGACAAAALLVSLASAALVLAALRIAPEAEVDPRQWTAHFTRQASGAAPVETEARPDGEPLAHLVEQHFRTRVVAEKAAPGAGAAGAAGNSSEAGPLPRPEADEERGEQHFRARVASQDAVRGAGNRVAPGGGVDFRSHGDQGTKKLSPERPANGEEAVVGGELRPLKEDGDVHHKEAHFRSRMSSSQVEL